MANTVRIKRRASGSPGAPTSLANAEVAFNEVDDVLYYGKGTGGAGGTATTVEAIGGKGAFVALSGDQTIAGTKTFSSTISGSVSGNAGTATTLATGRTIAITGDLTYTSGSFDGSANVTGTGTLANSGVTAGTYTKITVDAKGRATVGATASISDLSVPTADVAFNSKKITGLADPVSAQDAATKNYVDAVAQGIDAKASVRAASTANLTLSGAQTVDGIALVAGDRILVKDQSTTNQNGIYVVASGSWTRADDASTWAELVSAFVFVESGTVNADNGYLCTVDPGGTLGSTAVTFVQFSGAGQVIAGAGLTKTGNTIDAVGTANRITVNADSIDIASTYVGQTSITTLGTIATGTWQGTDVEVAYGGTGVSTLSGIAYGNGTSAFTAATAAQVVAVIGSTAVTNATNATNATNVGTTNDVATATTVYPTWVGASSGNNPIKTSAANLSFVPSSGTLTATAFSGSGASLTSLNATNLSSGTVASARISGSYTGITGVGTLAAGTWNGSTIAVSYGGTGVTTLTGLVKGNGTSAFSAAVAGTDYLSPSSDIDGGTF